MIQVVFVRVHEEELPQLRAWMKELGTRKSEVRETFTSEGTRHERVVLLSTSDGPIMVYCMEIENEAKARKAFASSSFPIDLQHRSVMKSITAEVLRPEILFDCQLDEPR